MDITYVNYPNAYIKVTDIMEEISLPRPKHKSKFLYNDDELLPIITLETGI